MGLKAFQNNKKEKESIDFMQLTVFPLLAERMNKEFDIFQELEITLEKNEINLEDGDVIVISTKYVSNSQGRIVDLETVYYTPLTQPTIQHV